MKTPILGLSLVVLSLSFSLNAEAIEKKEIVKKITDAARAAGIDPDLAVAIATVESGLNPNAVGGLNEQGLFQLRPEYHNVIPGNASHNILVGVAYLLEIKIKLKDKYGNAWFVGFNYGPYRKLKHPKQTAYYSKVMAELTKLKVKRYIAANF